MSSDIERFTLRLRDFAARRDWQQYHTPKNLAMALIAEAGELIEHFQWLTAAEAAKIGEDTGRLAAVADELADVGIYLVRLADVLGIDLSDAIARKIERNEERFPAIDSKDVPSNAESDDVLKENCETVEWEAVSAAADAIFSVWAGAPERRWAALAWEWLGRAGLTRYSNQIERQVAALRIVTLGEIYLDFCACAWDEYGQVWISEVLDVLPVSPFRLGQFHGREAAIDLDLDDGEAIEHAVAEVIDAQRSAVTESLLKGAGSASQLFTSLWLSNNDEYAGLDWDELDDDLTYSVLNDITFQKGKAFEWVEKGLPPYRA